MDTSVANAAKAFFANIFLNLYRTYQRATKLNFWLTLGAIVVANMLLHFVLIGLGPKAAWAQMVHTAINLFVWGTLAFGAAAAAGGYGQATEAKGDTKSKAEGTFRFCLGMIIAFIGVMVMSWIFPAHLDFLSFLKSLLLFCVGFGIGFLRKWSSDTPYVVLMRLCIYSATLFALRLFAPILYAVLLQNETGIWKAMGVALQRIISLHNAAMMHPVMGPFYFFAFLVVVGAALARRPLLGGGGHKDAHGTESSGSTVKGTISTIIVLMAVATVALIFTMLNFGITAPRATGGLRVIGGGSSFEASNLLAFAVLVMGLGGAAFTYNKVGNKTAGALLGIGLAVLILVIFQAFGVRT